MEKLNILEQCEVMGKTFTIYGTSESPLFLAKEVAGWIEHSQVVRMIENVDTHEKVMRIVHTLGGQQECWFLTEDGLYEVLMQSRKPIAKQFKSKVKEILRTLRKTGTYTINPAPKEDSQLARAQAMLLNARTRAAQTWLKIAASVGTPESKQVANTYAANVLADREVLTLPETKAKTYTATQIGEMLGVSANKIGKIANANNLKTPEYGIEVWDKSPYSAKQIPSWRYYENVIPVFTRILAQNVKPLEIIIGGAIQ